MPENVSVGYDVEHVVPKKRNGAWCFSLTCYWRNPHEVKDLIENYLGINIIMDCDDTSVPDNTFYNFTSEIEIRSFAIPLPRDVEPISKNIWPYVGIGKPFNEKDYYSRRRELFKGRLNG